MYPVRKRVIIITYMFHPYFVELLSKPVHKHYNGACHVTCQLPKSKLNSYSAPTHQRGKKKMKKNYYCLRQHVHKQ